MRVLVLGGTQFSGRALVRRAVEAGDEVTILHRGRHVGGEADGLPAGVRSIVGDRDPRAAEGAADGAGNGLARLAELVDGGERFDAVVDMCGYVPRVVRASAELLEPACGRYVFVSSVSVYPVGAEGSPGEGAPVLELEDPSVEEVTGETYGGLKVLCEREVSRVFGERAVHVRPGLIVGPDDPTDRFTYWPRRLARGGRVLVPAELDCPTRWIDARDLAAFMHRLAGGSGEGVYNVAAPEGAVGFGAFLWGVRRGVERVDPGAPACSFEAREGAWLEARGIAPWRDLPVFTGAGGSSMGRVRSERAHGAGLSCRPLEETAADTLVWDRERGSPELGAGLSAAREAEVLEV